MNPDNSPAGRARRYIAKMPKAVSGSGGHRATFAVACCLREFGLCWEEAWQLFIEWNADCLPPWPEGDLRHKLADAWRRTAPREAYAPCTGIRRPPSQAVPPARPCPALAPQPQPSAGTGPRLPALSAGTGLERSTLATLRGVSIGAVEDAIRRGLVAFGPFRGLRAWFLGDRTRRAVEARRLDGQPWAVGVKVWSLPGSLGNWPVGILQADPGMVLVLVEGAGDLLGVLDLAAAAGAAPRVAPVVMLGAAKRIHPDALPKFAGRRVRILAQADEAGRLGAERWRAELHDSGAAVDILNVGDVATRALGAPGAAGVKDWNDWAKNPAADFPACLAPIFPESDSEDPVLGKPL